MWEGAVCIILKISNKLVNFRKQTTGLQRLLGAIIFLCSTWRELILHPAHHLTCASSSRHPGISPQHNASLLAPFPVFMVCVLMGDGDFLMIRKKIEREKFLWHTMILCVYKEDSLGINWERKNQIGSKCPRHLQVQHSTSDWESGLPGKLRWLIAATPKCHFPQGHTFAQG